MSLTAGSRPLGERPAGRFDQPMPGRVLFIEGVPARIRGAASGETVVDSDHAMLLHGTGRLPVYPSRSPRCAPTCSRRPASASPAPAASSPGTG